ncbi:hypothetical protein E3U55_09350 [Filobacillus milosensis]|uniref:Protein kinase domain-containing protein n=1 Tax=Filobacillus milosensis TaxID=94137 RepID=A0A4Y8IJS7_9BACI|nr:protein kinase [Filobacillus milosensis]TFB21023.1 hypothetical protein E3U55_09350 [Filobacillus milosensis]
MTSSIHPTVRLTKHQRLKGIWNKRTYSIVKLLGEGARGSIYLATVGQKQVALKISQDSSVIAAEVNVLKALKKVQGMPLGPLLLDVDDATINHSQKHAFYVMEFIDGVPLGDWIQSHGLSWLFPISSQLLTQLKQLHELGYIFGDLKPDNILIDKQTKRARLVDVGGVTQRGRAIREYTTWFDRGYWKMGDRRAEPQYDLFAYAVCMLSMDPHIKIHKPGQKDIIKLTQQATNLKPLHSVIYKALKGQYLSAHDMKKDIEQVNSRQARVQKQRSPKKRKNKRTPSPWPEVIGISSILSIHLVLFYFFIM